MTHLLFINTMLGLSLPPVVCMMTHVLFINTILGLSLPPVVSMRTRVLFINTMLGLSLPSVVSMVTHVLFINTIFGSSLSPVVCMMTHVLFTLLLFVYVYCVVCLFVVWGGGGCLFSSSCVSYVTSIYELSVFDCTFGYSLTFTYIRRHVGSGSSQVINPVHIDE